MLSSYLIVCKSSYLLLIASPLKARVCVFGICLNVTFKLGLVGIRYAPRVPNSANYNGKRSTVDCRSSHCYVSLRCCALIQQHSLQSASVYAAENSENSNTELNKERKKN